MKISNQDITVLFDNPAATAAAHARLAALRAEAAELHTQIALLDETLRAHSVTTAVLDGVPLCVDDTTSNGGSYVKIHRVLFDGSRHAEVCRNVRTGEWMLIHYTIGGGDRIVARSSDKDALVQQGCEWVAGS